MNLSKQLSLFLFLALICACTTVEIDHQQPIELRDLEHNYDIEELSLEFDIDKVKLGRVLFYDNLLSLNGNVSCATCHQQEFAFGDNMAFSNGFQSGETFKNTPTLINAHFNSTFFWDSRSTTFVGAVLAPAFDTNEMGMDEEHLMQRINNADHYTDLIAAAYPDYMEPQSDGSSKANIKVKHVGEALAEFVSTMTAVDSKFDNVGKASAVMSTDEQAGLELFQTHCNSCHTAIGDAVVSAAVPPKYYTGGSRTSTLVNIGLELLPGQLQQVSVRIPTLRNIGSTAPYMHDGRFKTLQEVIDHYDEGVTGNNIDGRLRDETGKNQRLNLSGEEKRQLESFLLTLTDKVLETDEKWSSPFVSR